MPSPPTRTSSTTPICGMAKRSPPASTISAETMASVSGILMMKVVPWPSRERMSMVPPMRSMLVFTTSIPTPRPETAVTAAAVEKPGRKMKRWMSRSGIPASSASVARPCASTFWRILLDAQAAAVVADLDQDMPALVPRIEQ